MKRQIKNGTVRTPRLSGLSEAAELYGVTRRSPTVIRDMVIMHTKRVETFLASQFCTKVILWTIICFADYTVCIAYFAPSSAAVYWVHINNK